MHAIKMRTSLVASLLVGSLFSFYAPASFSQNADAIQLYHRGLAATCANCHGTDGKGIPDGGMPLINEYTSEQLLTQLLAFKTGTREGTIMPQLAKGYSDAQLEIIAKQLGRK